MRNKERELCFVIEIMCLPFNKKRFSICCQYITNEIR